MIRAVVRDGVPVGWSFRCPGCEDLHWFQTVPLPGEPRIWTRSGPDSAPTFTPSLITTVRGEHGVHRCHLFMRDGALQFLHDCSHHLAGQTVKLEPAE